MSTFNLPNSKPDVPVHLTPDLEKDQLLSFPAFKTWISTLQHSLNTQHHPSHTFHSAPYKLRKIDIQCVDFFGGGRIGFIKLKAEVSNDNGEMLPGSVFLRGGSVGMMLTLQPDDVPEGTEDEKHVILTLQPRIPAGSLSMVEIPAGMLDDSGSFSGGAAKEIEEETGLKVPAKELINMTELALPEGEGGNEEHLQQGIYPSAGGSDEFIPLFLWQKRIPRAQMKEWQGKLTGLRDHGEKITLMLAPLKSMWKVGGRDGKALGAWALYEALRREGKI
ncbi:ADP-sugar diphosphatase, partial [Lecanoromycetidae sp. Uapishka_2]